MKTVLFRPFRLMIALALATGTATAADVSYNGSFQHDADVQFFSFTTLGTVGAAVVLQTTSWANVPNGGFDPSLTLLDATGQILYQNEDASSTVYDSYIKTVTIQTATYEPLKPNTEYWVALYQWGNSVPIKGGTNTVYDYANPLYNPNPNLINGYYYYKNLTQHEGVDYTSALGGCPTGNFCGYDSSNNAVNLSSNWALEIKNVVSAQLENNGFTPSGTPPPGPVIPGQTPEPGTLALLSLGLVAMRARLKEKS